MARADIRQGRGEPCNSMDIRSPPPPRSAHVRWEPRSDCGRTRRPGGV